MFIDYVILREPCPGEAPYPYPLIYSGEGEATHGILHKYTN